MTQGEDIHEGKGVCLGEVGAREEGQIRSTQTVQVSVVTRIYTALKKKKN